MSSRKMSHQSALVAVLLLSSIAMTQQPVSAAQPWPTNIDPTTDTRGFPQQETTSVSGRVDVGRPRLRSADRLLSHSDGAQQQNGDQRRLMTHFPATHGSCR